jgi:ribosomal protein S18 acetylase RimI-like enzyme
LRVYPKSLGYDAAMDPRDDLLQTSVPDSSAPGWRPPPWLPVRSLGERHRERVLTHLLALDEQDRHRRFGHIASDEQIAGYVARIDFERDEVFGIFDGRLRLVAMAHLAYAGTGGAAEFGVSVLPRGRGRGFGRRLFELAVLHARNRGAHTLVIHLARDNAPMLAIVRRSGATVRYEGSDAVAHLTLPEDSIGSHLGALAESQAANLDYRLKLQALRWRALWQRGAPSRGN